MKIPRVRQYPKTLMIGEQEYRLKFVRRIRGHDASTQGLCDVSDHVIYIKLGQTPVEVFSTFVHEVLHAFEAEHNIEISHGNVYRLEKGLVDFLLANF